MKIKPYLFLIVLFVILFFIIGVRYGQKVEQANKAINYYLSLPPAKPPEPTVSMKLIDYIHKPCGISFMIPYWYIKENETSTSAQFNVNKEGQLFFSCNKIPIPSSLIPIEKNVIFIQKKNIKTNQIISFAVKDSLAKLIEATFEFITITP